MNEEIEAILEAERLLYRTLETNASNDEKLIVREDTVEEGV